MTAPTFRLGDRVYITAAGYLGPSIDVITDIRPASSGAWLYVVDSGAWLTAFDFELMEVKNDLTFPYEEMHEGPCNCCPHCMADFPIDHAGRCFECSNYTDSK